MISTTRIFRCGSHGCSHNTDRDQGSGRHRSPLSPYSYWPSYLGWLAAYVLFVWMAAWFGANEEAWASRLAKLASYVLMTLPCPYSCWPSHSAGTEALNGNINISPLLHYKNRRPKPSGKTRNGCLPPSSLSLFHAGHRTFSQDGDSSTIKNTIQTLY